MVNMWMVRAGEKSFLIDDFIDNNLVAIGWNLGDLTYKSDDEIAELYEKKYKNHKSLNQILNFKNTINIYDYVITTSSVTKTYFLGKITSDYYFSDKITKTDSSNDNYYDLRDVEWFGEVQRNDFNNQIKKSVDINATVFEIDEMSREDILKIYRDRNDEIEKSAKIIRNYLDDNNLGSFENKEYEQALIKFKEDFSPKKLASLEGLDIINKIFEHDGDKNNLCYALEFNKDYLFAGSISGGSAFKFGLFKRVTTGEWTAGSPRKSKIVTENEAIEIGGKIRDSIVKGAEIIENFDLNSVNDYMRLEMKLGEVFDNCDTSPLTQWIHKYYVLMFPEKFPVVHWDKMKRDFLEKFNITLPQKWTYAFDGKLQLLTKKSGIKGYSLFEDEILELFNETSSSKPFESDLKRNIIYFGAPGTGKSYNLNQDKDILLENYPENYERVTFHPDYSYANFVGTYKPVPDGKDITYTYVPGPFMRILKNALDNPNKPYLLIIEEINRANVAAVFGDVFQLLDRNENNESEYDIETSHDMRRYLNEDKIKLPSNLFIWATMNSADQGVFPMDTAFKRRWDFKYFSINSGEDLIKDTKTMLNGVEINWNTLRKAINSELLSYKINEDKLMGPFFAFNEFMNEYIDEEIFKDIFKNKIIMYLFEDAARSRRNELFSGIGKTNVTYSQICEKFEEEGIEIFTDSIKDKFVSEEDN